MRVFDFLITTIAIILLFPFLLFISLILKLTGEHRVLFKQERVGKNEKVFRILKFQTMVKDSPNMIGGLITRKNDPRLLPFGRILKKKKLNELPQLINVWLGQMSLVGPRPLPVEHYNNYSEEQKKLISRLSPGLTGMGSLVFIDEESVMDKSEVDSTVIHDTVIARYKGDLECWYSENKGIALYFKILIFTVIAIMKPGFDITGFFKNLPEPDELIKNLLHHQVL